MQHNSAVEGHAHNLMADRLLFGSYCCIFFFIPIATSPAIIAGAVAISTWVLSGKFIREREQWLHQEWTIPVVIFMLLPLVGLLWSEDPAMGMVFIRKSYYWLYAFAIVSVCSIYPPGALINAFLAGLSLNVAVSLLQYGGLVPLLKGTPAGFMGHIAYSLLLVFGMLLLSFYYSKGKKKKYQILILLLMAAYAFNLSVNIGRIGYIAFVLVSPWVLYNMLGRKHINMIVLIVIAGTVMLSYSPTVQNRTRLAVDELTEYYEGHKNTSVGRRPYMWEGAIKMFLHNPVLGVGTGGYQKALAKYRDDPALPDIIHPHNTFLYMMSSYGIVGLLSFLWLLVVFIKKGWKARDTIEGFSVLSYGIILLIGSMTDTQVLSVSTGMMFALLTGMRDDRQSLKVPSSGINENC